MRYALNCKQIRIFTLTLLALFMFDISFTQTVQTSHTNLDLNAVFFINANSGWCVGASGTILRTTDGGIDWKLQVYDINLVFSDVQFVNEKVGYIVGDRGYPNFNNGVVLKTTDGGENWIRVRNCGSRRSSALFFVDENEGWISENLYSTYKSRILKTVDGGETWVIQLHEYDTYSYKSFFINNQTGWFTAIDTKVYHTTDGGENWQIQLLPEDGPWAGGYNLTDIFFLNVDEGWVIAHQGNLKTINGGKDWIDIGRTPDLKWGPHCYGLFLADKNNGTICIYDDGFYKTNDAGASWQLVYGGNEREIYKDTYIVDLQNAWGVGSGGLIVKFVVNESSSSIENDVTSTSKSFNMFQNYPNPFNPSTTIRFHLTQSQNVQLKIFNIHGQEIQTLVNDVVSAGEHSIQWHADDLPAGIYLASLQAGDQLRTLKLILLK